MASSSIRGSNDGASTSKAASRSKASTSTATATTSTAATAPTAAKRPRAPKTTATATMDVIAEPAVIAPAPVADTPATVTDAVVPDAEAETETAGATTRVTAEDVIGIINSTTQKLRNEIVLAKARKDKESSATLTEIIKNLNSIRKPIDRLAKSKPQRKTSTVDPNNNGLLKPVKISKELATFLNCDENELKSRVQVTRSICKYIKEHDLQDPADLRRILVDDNLASLLKLDKAGGTPKILYCDIQRLLKAHYTKTIPDVATTPTASASA